MGGNSLRPKPVEIVIVILMDWIQYIEILWIKQWNNGQNLVLTQLKRAVRKEDTPFNIKSLILNLKMLFFKNFIECILTYAFTTSKCSQILHLSLPFQLHVLSLF